MEYILTCCIDCIVWQFSQAVPISLILMSNDNLSSVLTKWYVCPYLYIVGSNRFIYVLSLLSCVVHHVRLSVGGFLPCSI